MFITLRDPVQERHPREQGLKQEIDATTRDEIARSRATSTRTRIETLLRNMRTIRTQCSRATSTRTRIETIAAHEPPSTPDGCSRATSTRTRIETPEGAAVAVDVNHGSRATSTITRIETKFRGHIYLDCMGSRATSTRTRKTRVQPRPP